MSLLVVEQRGIPAAIGGVVRKSVSQTITGARKAGQERLSGTTLPAQLSMGCSQSIDAGLAVSERVDRELGERSSRASVLDWPFLQNICCCIPYRLIYF